MNICISPSFIWTSRNDIIFIVNGNFLTLWFLWLLESILYKLSCVLHCITILKYNYNWNLGIHQKYESLLMNIYPSVITYTTSNKIFPKITWTISIFKWPTSVILTHSVPLMMMVIIMVMMVNSFVGQSGTVGQDLAWPSSVGQILPSRQVHAGQGHHRQQAIHQPRGGGSHRGRNQWWPRPEEGRCGLCYGKQEMCHLYQRE